ncbi:MAG TPA: hypothetical protein PLH33_07120, partial [Chitinophagaceae bacterium]|nr:hypothetical protein [Chitinophagaceae bacterium]
MISSKKMLHPITILLLVTIIAAIATWLLPAGTYNKLSVSEKNFVINSNGINTHVPLTQNTLDSLHIIIPLEKFTNGDITKPVSIPNTYQATKSNRTTFIQLLSSPIKGIYDAIDIVLLILVMGGFIYVFNETGAMLKGISYL